MSWFARAAVLASQVSTVALDVCARDGVNVRSSGGHKLRTGSRRVCAGTRPRGQERQPCRRHVYAAMLATGERLSPLLTRLPLHCFVAAGQFSRPLSPDRSRVTPGRSRVPCSLRQPEWHHAARPCTEMDGALHSSSCTNIWAGLSHVLFKRRLRWRASAPPLLAAVCALPALPCWRVQESRPAWPRMSAPILCAPGADCASCDVTCGVTLSNLMSGWCCNARATSRQLAGLDQRLALAACPAAC